MEIRFNFEEFGGNEGVAFKALLAGAVNGNLEFNSAGQYVKVITSNITELERALKIARLYLRKI